MKSRLKRVLSLMGLALFCVQQAWADSSIITLKVYIPKSEEPKKTVFVTGEGDFLCNWKPKCLPLVYVGSTEKYKQYEANVEVPETVNRLEFKFSLGSWRTEAQDAAGKNYNNFMWERSSQFKTLNIMVESFRNNYLLNDVQGNLKEFPYFKSKFLKAPRTVYVWTPGNSQNVECYKVLFAHDGQNLFSKSDSNYGAEWKLDEALGKLIEQGAVNPTLVIASDSTDYRYEEYHYKFLGENYARFLLEEVYPFVAQKYRLCEGRENTFVMGSSRGGLVSFALLYRYSKFFSKAAGLSMHLSIPRASGSGRESSQPLFHKIFRDLPLPVLPVNYYMDHGDMGLDRSYPLYAQQFKDLFQEYLPNSKITYKKFQNADHTEEDWALRLPEVLIDLLN